MNLSLESGGQIEATVEFYDASSSTHVALMHNTPIPSNSTQVVIGGDAKVVLEGGII